MNDLTSMAYSTRYKEKNTIPDSRILVFMTGFFLGLVFFYFTGKQLINDSELLSQEYMETLKNFTINQREYLFYIVEIRMKQILFVLLCSLSIWACCCLYALLGFAGFQLGILFFAAMYQYGMLGLFYCIFMLLPHGIFYYLAFVQVLSRKMENSRNNPLKNMGMPCNKARKIVENLKMILFVCVQLGLGILSESYINPWLMKWILLFF